MGGLRWPKEDNMESLPKAAGAAASCDTEPLHSDADGDCSKGFAATTGQGSTAGCLGSGAIVCPVAF